VKTAVRKQATHDFLVALSLANLCFLKVWRELIYADAADSYWLPDYTVQSYLAVIINLAALTLILYGVIAYLIRSDRRWLAVTGRLIFLGILIFPIYFLLTYAEFLKSKHGIPRDYAWIFGFVVLATPLIFLYFVVWRLRAATNLFQFICLLFFPFAVLNVAHAMFAGITLEQQITSAPMNHAQASPPTQNQRVVWLLMDELDFRLAFVDRPDGVVLPEFDRLRSQSLFALNADSNALDTREAIPSYLLQRIVEKAEPIGPAELKITYKDKGKSADTVFPGGKNVFSAAARRGARIAILGYYHPYCRLFRDEAVFCRSYPTRTYALFPTNNVLREAWSQLVGILPFRHRINAIIMHRHGTELVSQIVGNASFDFVFMHASVPHRPHIWKEERFVLWNRTAMAYFDNLRLADRLLGEVRANMERAGLWDTTAVLVTSDHEWRNISGLFGKRTQKIPFLLKMPGQKASIDIKYPFSPMQVTKDLLLEIHAKKLSTPKAVADWLVLRTGGK
jgi:hypothetical protein